MNEANGDQCTVHASFPDIECTATVNVTQAHKSELLAGRLSLLVMVLTRQIPLFSDSHPQRGNVLERRGERGIMEMGVPCGLEGGGLALCRNLRGKKHPVYKLNYMQANHPGAQKALLDT